MKKRVKIDLSWRAWSLIIGFFILIGFVGLSFAYGGNTPSVMGHSAGEIEGGVGGAGSTTIVSSCMPNYNVGVSLSIGVLNGSLEYRAPSDGWFMGTAGQGTASKSNISINGNLIIYFQDLYGTGGGNTNWAGFSIPVRMNDQIILTSKPGSSTWAKFYPCLNAGSGSAGSADYVVESWRAADSSSYYRKYKSGWIEQGGFRNGTVIGGSSYITVSYPVEFTKIMHVDAIPYQYPGTDYLQGININSLNNKNVTFVLVWDYSYNNGVNSIPKFYWSAEGFYN
jgi:hypothetical protein